MVALRNSNSTLQNRGKCDSKISHRNDRSVSPIPEFPITNLSLFALDLFLINLVNSNMGISFKYHPCLGLQDLTLVPNKDWSPSEDALPTPRKTPPPRLRNVSPLPLHASLCKSCKIIDSKSVEIQNHVLPNLKQQFPNKILLSNPTKIEC